MNISVLCFVASTVMIAVSFKIVYLTHSLTLPFWGN